MSSVPINEPLHPPLSDAERALAGRLRKHVEMLAGLIGPRHLGRPSSLEAAAEYVFRELRSTGEHVERQSYELGNHRPENFVLERRGTSRPEEIVILGAHYDTVPETPGADDNASAVAVMIETMKLLHGKNSKRTMRFVAFTNEEPPNYYTDTMGSQVYARRCRERGEKVIGMLCLEMVGYFDTRPGSQQYPPRIPAILRRLMPQRGHFIGMVSNLVSWRLFLRARRGFRKAIRFPLVAIPLPQAIEEIRRSDHGPFWDLSFPALMITDTSFFRNANYHMPTDTPDTLDYERMARVTIGVSGAMMAVAGGSSRIPVVK